MQPECEMVLRMACDGYQMTYEEAKNAISDLTLGLDMIRRENRALQQYANLEFHPADNGQVLFESKTTKALDNVLFIIVSLDPWNVQETFITVPIEKFGWIEGDAYQVHDLLTDDRYLWRGARNFVRLEPGRPCLLACLSRAAVGWARAGCGLLFVIYELRFMI